MANYWAKISERFDEWTSPLRPCSEDVEMFRNQLASSERSLLLGVTSELQPLATVAIDHNPRVIEIHKAQAVLGDWGALPFESEFDVVFGDGSLNIFQETPELFFQQVKRALKTNGRLVLRVFISPESKEVLADVLKRSGEMGFHAFKWSFNLSVITRRWNFTEIQRSFITFLNYRNFLRGIRSNLGRLMNSLNVARSSLGTPQICPLETRSDSERGSRRGSRCVGGSVCKWLLAALG